jgi:hypothetical protein
LHVARRVASAPIFKTYRKAHNQITRTSLVLQRLLHAIMFAKRADLILVPSKAMIFATKPVVRG